MNKTITPTHRLNLMRIWFLLTGEMRRRDVELTEEEATSLRATMEFLTESALRPLPRVDGEKKDV